MKNLKHTKEWHVANTKYGMGDNYGTGIKAKIGTIRQDYINIPKSSMKKLGTPPKNLA